MMLYSDCGAGTSLSTCQPLMVPLRRSGERVLIMPSFEYVTGKNPHDVCFFNKAKPLIFGLWIGHIRPSMEPFDLSICVILARSFSFLLLQ